MNSAGGGPGQGKGRPRDPKVEGRAYAAAMELYAEIGIAGMTFDAIAARAKVGKPALYRRWSSVQELLLSAFARSAQERGLVDTGTLRGDLVLFARVVLGLLVDDPGLASIRLVMDARMRPELFPHLSDSSIGHAFRSAREIVPRAVERGDLPAGSSPTMLIEVLVGGILIRVLTGSISTDTPEAVDEAYVEALVDLCLRGAASA